MIDWPLDSNVIRKGVENNTFGKVRRNLNGSPRAHQGWDFFAPIGTPCYAIADGKIARVGTHQDYGLFVVQSFEHEGKVLYAAFCHLDSYAVQPGEAVKRGQQIGRTGDSGNAKGMKSADLHLHFEIRTIPSPGRGLEGRMSPLKVFGTLPLKAPVKRQGAA